MATSTFTNPPFDKRMTASKPWLMPAASQSTGAGASQTQVLERGYIIQDQPQAGIKNQCNFLYNPSVLYANHVAESNVVVDSNAVNPNPLTAADSLLMPLQSTLQFSLLFDRFYEMYDPASNGSAAWTDGVFADINALYRITGISSPVAAVSGTSGTTAAVSSDTAFAAGTYIKGAVGPMRYVPARFYFAGSRSGILNYYGVITSLNITYTHFTQQMIPFRCQVDIIASILPTPTPTTTKSTTSSSSNPTTSSSTVSPITGANGPFTGVNPGPTTGKSGR